MYGRFCIAIAQLLVTIMAINVVSEKKHSQFKQSKHTLLILLRLNCRYVDYLYLNGCYRLLASSPLKLLNPLQSGIGSLPQ